MEEKTINVMDLLLLAWRRLWVIILVAIIFAAGAFGYNKFLVTPLYSATASIVVTNGGMDMKDIGSVTEQEKVTASDLSASIYLIETVMDVLKTNDFYENVAQKIAADNGKTYENGDGRSIKGMTSITRRSEESLFVDITVTSSDPQKAMEYANAMARVASNDDATYDKSTPTSRVRYNYIRKTIPNTITITTETAVSYAKTHPQTFRWTVIFGAIGAVIAYAVLFIIESTNRAIKGEEDFTSRFDVPLLGAVPDFENADAAAYRKKKGRGGYAGGY